MIKRGIMIFNLNLNGLHWFWWKHTHYRTIYIYIVTQLRIPFFFRRSKTYFICSSSFNIVANIYMLSLSSWVSWRLVKLQWFAVGMVPEKIIHLQYSDLHSYILMYLFLHVFIFVALKQGNLVGSCRIYAATVLGHLFFFFSPHHCIKSDRYDRCSNETANV